MGVGRKRHRLALLQAARSRLAMETQLTATDTTTLVIADLVSEWLTTLDTSADTKRAYRLGLVEFIEWLDGHQVTPALIRRWRDELRDQYSAATVNVRLSAVRSFYAWVVDSGWMADNPAAGVKGATRRGTTKAHKRRELTAGELRGMKQDTIALWCRQSG
jgi:site-specific recombinase XerC